MSRAIDDKKARWLKLSPLLDELLELDPPARAARLDELRGQDAALAEELQALLAREAGMDDAGFLASPVLPRQLAQAGQTLGAYTLEQEIGRGGMGSVWRARRTDGRFEGRVAIKFLASGLFGHGHAGRFAREGQILARLAHPHIARLLDAGVTPDGSQPYLVLEHVEDGEPIDRYCERLRLGTRERVRLFLDVLAAVAHAHNRLILHRDLKPSNILVDRQGAVKLLDFGIAKLLQDDGLDAGAATELTRQAGRAFTPQYAAPEQVQGGDVTTATDVYALGVLLYLLLGGSHPTGTLPATASQLEQLRTVVEVEPKRLSELRRGRGDRMGARELRGDLDTIVAKALKKKPAERYANAAELAEDLRRWLAHEPVAARPDSRAYRAAKFLRRHRVGVAAGSLVALSLAGGIGVALWQAREAHQQRVEAEGLIEFMLGDLRQKLEPVGRLDVLDAVGAKALDYYTRQRLAALDADSLGRRAQALHLMGEIAEKRGRLPDAAALFEQAARSTEELLRRDPRHPQRLFEHGQSVYWVGYAARQQGRLAEAQQWFERYLSLSEQLVRLAPAETKWQIELAYARHNLGVLAVGAGHAGAAQQHFRASADVWQALLPAQPALAKEFAATLGWLADAQERQGLYADSMASHQRKLALLQRRAEAAGARELQQSRADTLAALSRIELNVGHVEASAASLAQALRLYEALAAVDTANLDMLSRLAVVRERQAEVMLLAGTPAAARPVLQQAWRELQRLLQADASKPAWSIALQGRWLAAQLQLGGPGDAQALQAAAELLDRAFQTFPEGPAGSNAGNRLALGMAALALGDALQAGADRDGARRRWAQGLQALQHPADADSDVVTCLRAQALQRLGRAQEARGLAEKLEASAFRHPLYVELRQRLGLVAMPRPTPASQRGNPS